MANWNERSKRFKTGGKRSKFKKHKKHQRSRSMNPVEIDDTFVKKVSARGGNTKHALLSSNKANLMVNGKAEVVDIQEVEKNPANSHFERRDIMTKGSIIKTSKGKAVVTSRPGQDGTINAKLLEE